MERAIQARREERHPWAKAPEPVAESSEPKAPEAKPRKKPKAKAAAAPVEPTAAAPEPPAAPAEGINPPDGTPMDEVTEPPKRGRKAYMRAPVEVPGVCKKGDPIQASMRKGQLESIRKAILAHLNDKHTSLYYSVTELTDKR